MNHAISELKQFLSQLVHLEIFRGKKFQWLQEGLTYFDIAPFKKIQEYIFCDFNQLLIKVVFVLDKYSFTKPSPHFLCKLNLTTRTRQVFVVLGNKFPPTILQVIHKRSS